MTYRRIILLTVSLLVAAVAGATALGWVTGEPVNHAGAILGMAGLGSVGAVGFFYNINKLWEETS